MKEMWNSFLQTVIQFVKDLCTGMTKAMHRNAVLMTAGISVVTMLAFMAGDLHVGGNNGLVAFAETLEHIERVETELEEADSDESATDKEHIDQTDAETEETMIGETTANAEPETRTVPVSAEEAAEVDQTEEAEPETEPVTAENEEDAEEESEETETEETAEEAVEEAAAPIVLSESDYNTLLRIVQAESGGCDIEGRILVANVILNRVESDEFPDSIHGVVYQKSQFSPVIDGSINRCKVTEETKEAVDRALNGEDLSEGALYFMNRSKSSKKNVRWFDTKLSFLFKHGEHEFFK